jgi:hypothetical protein
MAKRKKRKKKRNALFSQDNLVWLAQDFHFPSPSTPHSGSYNWMVWPLTGHSIKEA